MADLRCQRGPHVFVDDLEVPTLADDDRHHLARSLRLRDGDPLTISDGARRWRTARFGEPIEVEGPILVVAAPPWPATIACALAKGAKPELVVQKATEIGIDHIVFFTGDHSVPTWDAAKRAKAGVRLARVAREAAMQSRQVRLPTIELADDLASVAAAVPELVRADFGGKAIDRSVRAVAVGPEGGWSDAERQSLPEAVDLGPTVLRAETAALVAATRLTAWRGVSPG